MQCTPQCQASGKGDMCYPARTAGRAYQADVDHVTILNRQDPVGEYVRDGLMQAKQAKVD
ncbi:hypothetical protein MAR_013149 [Mya arenaria]|uniref:Uncharacterized protein n=1 Tax=Mya arenaria TaxID=6604 RepID=A0ABY7FZ12_MYAAR|nr:hypothetical protein MAR_013149 [Mya arenaria]